MGAGESRVARKLDTIMNVVIAALGLLALLQWSWRRSDGATEAGPGRWLAVEPGQEITTRVTSGGRAVGPIAMQGAGKCRYIVIFSTSCGASSTAAKQWGVTLREQNYFADHASDWEILWVSSEAEPAPAGFFPDDFPVPIFASESPGALVKELGIRAYPAHLVLDRQGRVVKGDVGAPIPTSDDLRRDCQIEAWR